MRSPPEGVNVPDDQGYFSVACRCRSTKLRLLGYPHPNAGMLCPVDVECADCRRQAPLFDVEVHGYDAELGHGCYSMRAIGQHGAWTCSHCAEQSFELYVGFSYQIDPLEGWSLEDQARIQDLFDGLEVASRCGGCGVLSAPVSYECS